MSASGLGTYESSWRASACEAVPYSSAADGDFPAVLATWPEVADNAIFAGKATEITLNVNYIEGNMVQMVTSNNGRSLGTKDSDRYREWTAKKSTSALNNYGHGEKKHLTKAQPEYDAEHQWAKYSRPPGGSLTKISGPFRNAADMVQEDVDSPSILPNGGVATETFVDLDLLNTITRRPLSKPGSLFPACKEIIRSRYGEYIDDGSVKFYLNINDEHKWDSDTSHSLESYLQGMVERGAAKLCIDESFEVPGGKLDFTLYHIYQTKKEEIRKLKAEFPIYGLRGKEGSRIFISKEKRMIEPRPLHTILHRSPHDDFNGYKGFIKFRTNTGSAEECDLLPKATTTKVAFMDDDKPFCHGLDLVRESIERNKPTGGWNNLIASVPTIVTNTPISTLKVRRAPNSETSSVSSESTNEFAESTFALDSFTSVSSPTKCPPEENLRTMSEPDIHKALKERFGIEIEGGSGTVTIKMSADEIKTITGKGVATAALRDVLRSGAFSRGDKERALKYLRLQIESYN